MKTGDILLKKWCFGIGRAKPRKMVEQNRQGEAVTYITYPKYRTIALVVETAERKGKTWHVKGKQYASLTGKPKSVEITLDVKGSEKRPHYTVGTQKRPFHLIPMANAGGIVSDDGMPPVGSLISVNKKHAIVVEVGRNQLTVFVDGKYESLTATPGSIKWFSDKILKSICEKK
tara:strand:- start:1215 stop:1736 length:522 start_codon:yes stop_codon:yes gene_type:complete